MTSLKQYEIVRVVQMLHPLEEYDSWHANKCTPQVGDTGTIVEILQSPNLPTKYTVEAVEPDGATLWLSDFDADEIVAV
jgi:hypothetical protein